MYEIEELTNLDFFSFLPRKAQDEVETLLPTVMYYSSRVSFPDKDSDGVHGNRVTPERRSKLKCD